MLAGWFLPTDRVLHHCAAPGRGRVPALDLHRRLRRSGVAAAGGELHPDAHRGDPGRAQCGTADADIAPSRHGCKAEARSMVERI